MILTRLSALAAVIATTITATTIAGCMQLNSRPSRDADLAAITAFNRRYLQAINEGDFPSLSALTVEDHIMMAPNQPAIVGKQANDEANRRAFERFRFSEQWMPLDTVIDGDLAYQRGTFTTAATPRQGGQTRSVAGKFLRIYRRLPDRSWNMVIDMFNDDPPERSLAAPGADRNVPSITNHASSALSK